MNIKEEFIKYCNEHWSLPQYETDKALDVMDKMRCPLSVANVAVTSHIEYLAEDFAYDNDLDEDWLDDYDIEEIFWKIEL